MTAPHARTPLRCVYVVSLAAPLAANPVAAVGAVAHLVTARVDVFAAARSRVLLADVALWREVEQRREGVV